MNRIPIAVLVFGLIASATLTGLLLQQDSGQAHATQTSNNIITLTGGGDHDCILDVDGVARCWGSDNDNQLGAGYEGDTQSPVEIQGLESGLATIDAGGFATCAITSAGGAACWGYALGLGHNAPVPKTYPGLDTDVRQASVGWAHSCFNTEQNGVSCVGASWAGQLGGDCDHPPELYLCSVPIPVSGLPENIVGLLAAHLSTCAIAVKGDVWCWGANYGGQLGDGTTVDSVTPVTVKGLSGPVVQMDGFRQICAVLQSGVLQCWGPGFGSIPVAVGGLSEGVSSVAVGDGHICALTNRGGVKCWGQNFRGQLGNGTGQDTSVPTQVPGLNAGVRAIVANHYASCALVLDYVMCWGDRYGPTPVVVPDSEDTVLVETPGDNCIGLDNSDQLNTDGDNLGDACDPDDDNDGLSDADEKVLSTDPTLADTDGDGCSDGRELGDDPAKGGQRDPLNSWDFYDVAGFNGGPKDGVVDLANDILGVVLHIGAANYDVRYDRGPSTGPHPWNMTAPDGTIDLANDLLGVVQQHGHHCA